MEHLRATIQPLTLVDQVEDKLLNYLKESDISVGDSIPNEIELAATIGVARSVLREALSRLKMLGIIETRPRRGMIMTAPSVFNGLKRIIDPRILDEQTVFEMLHFRITLEIGMCSDLFLNLTEEDLCELDDIIKHSVLYENNEYDPYSEYNFHAKLYEIAGNKIVSEFQEMVYPLMTFVNKKFKDLIEPINIELEKEGKIVTHKELFSYLKERDEDGFTKALKNHFLSYKRLMRSRT